MPDYAFYQAMGGALSEADFTRLRGRAWAYLDALTMGLAVPASLPKPYVEKVKLACCAVVDEYAAQEQGGEVVSASNDGYSETYAGSGRTAAQRLYIAAALYLVPTGLLYAGMGGYRRAGLY